MLLVPPFIAGFELTKEIFSSENWTDVLYSAMSNEFEWKQGWLAAIFLCAWFLFSYCGSYQSGWVCTS